MGVEACRAEHFCWVFVPVTLFYLFKSHWRDLPAIRTYFELSSFGLGVETFVQTSQTGPCLFKTYQ